MAQESNIEQGRGALGEAIVHGRHAHVTATLGSAMQRGAAVAGPRLREGRRPTHQAERLRLRASCGTQHADEAVRWMGREPRGRAGEGYKARWWGQRSGLRERCSPRGDRRDRTAVRKEHGPALAGPVVAATRVDDEDSEAATASGMAAHTARLWPHKGALSGADAPLSTLGRVRCTAVCQIGLLRVQYR
jgi:hypothetical protein